MIYETMVEFNRYMQVKFQDKKYKCQICDEKYKTLEEVNGHKHEKKHLTKENTYKCRIL